MKQFIEIFDRIATNTHRLTVFEHFVTMSACAIHNRLVFCQTLEDQYMALQKRYDKQQMDGFSELLAVTIVALDNEPQDYLGSLFMSLDLGNKKTAQFFTPYEISRLMSKLLYPNEGFDECVDRNGYITCQDPACGAGSMPIAFYQQFKEAGYDPNTQLFLSCIDIDPTAAMMCYIQLTALGVPAEVIIGDSLNMEFVRTMKTPAYYRFDWPERLSAQR